MLNLDAALAGDLLIYRYEWQPLSYQWGGFLVKVFGTPQVLFYLHTIYITLALSIIIFQCCRKFNTPFHIAIVILLFTPELFFTALYYNSSAPAFLCAVIAFSIAIENQSAFRAITIGLLCAIAVFQRLDFLLIMPCIFMVYIITHKNIKFTMVGLASFILIASIIFLSGIVTVDAIIDGYVSAKLEIIEKQNTGGWDRYAKNMVTSVVFSPVGWIYFSASIIILTKKMSVDQRKTAFFLLISFLPTLAVVPDLLSVKYLLPAFVIFPFFAAYAWTMFRTVLNGRQFRFFSIMIIVSTFIHLIVSLEPTTKTPYINVTVSDARKIGTHDGPRSWGGYVSQLLKVKKNRSNNESFVVGKLLTDTLLSGGVEKLYYVGDQSYFSEGAAGWRYAYLMLAVEGYHGELVESGVVRFMIGQSEFWLFDDRDKQVKMACVDKSICVVTGGEVLPDCLIQE